MSDLDKGPHAAGTFCWSELATKDVARAKAFYAEVLGIVGHDVPMPGGAEGAYTMLRLGDGDLGGAHTLSPEEEAAGAHPYWGTYVAVDDVDATAKMAKSLGAAILAEPFEIPGVGRMAVLRDPQGAVFHVWHTGSPHPGKAHFPQDQMGAVCWNELVTDDTDAAAGFYGELFGWAAEKQDMGGVAYTTFNFGEKGVGGLMAKSPEMGDMCSAWVLYFLVPDADATIARAESLGGKAFFPPMTLPEVGRFTWLADDQGCVFGIVEPPK